MPRSDEPDLPVFRPGEKDLKQALGTLEAQVMEVVWDGDDLSVEEVRAELAERNKQAAYTTIMTTLDRLYKKGFLSRRRVGKAYRYSAKVSRGDLGKNVARKVLDGLLSSFAEPAIAYFVEAISQSDPEKLDALAKKIAEQKSRRDGGGG